MQYSESLFIDINRFSSQFIFCSGTVVPQLYEVCIPHVKRQ